MQMQKLVSIIRGQEDGAVQMTDDRTEEQDTVLGLETKPYPTEPLTADKEWKCACGATNKGKFCEECGSPCP